MLPVRKRLLLSIRFETEYCYFCFGRSSRISRNSFGPLISARLRRCCSSTGIDLSTIRSTARPASSEAFWAFRLFAALGSAERASARSTIRRIASGLDGWFV